MLARDGLPKPFGPTRAGAWVVAVRGAPPGEAYFIAVPLVTRAPVDGHAAAAKCPDCGEGPCCGVASMCLVEPTPGEAYECVAPATAATRPRSTRYVCT